MEFSGSRTHAQPTVALVPVDAGVCLNAPLPPLALLAPERELDVILISDARPTDFDVHDSKDVLRRLEIWAHDRGLVLPPLAYHEVGLRPMTIFEHSDPDTAGPVLVYLPLVKNAEFSDAFDPATSCKFTEFTFAPAEFDRLLSLARHNAASTGTALVALLGRVARRKRAARLNSTA